MRTLNRYFDDYACEASQNNIALMNGTTVYINGEKVCDNVYEITEKKSEYFTEDYLAIYDYKLYFIARGESQSQSFSMSIYVGSVKFDGSELKYDYVGDFGDEKNEISCAQTYLSDYYACSSHNEQCNYCVTSVYFDKSIYIRDVNRIVKYNILTGEQIESKEEQLRFLFESKYVVLSYDKMGNNLEVLNKETNISKTVSLQEMAKSSQAAQRMIDELSKYNRWDGGSYIDRPNFTIYQRDDKLYTKMAVYNRQGIKIPVVFEWDFDNDKFYFVSAAKPDFLSTRSYLVSIVHY